MNNKNNKPMVLIILDGWGVRNDNEHNAINLAQTPMFDELMAHFPHTLLDASGEAVGLPRGQMGNSEVGHLHMGSGRKVPQDLTRIDQSIQTGDFYKNPVLLDAIQKAKQTDHAVHVLGLLSPGGVHSRDNQIAAMIDMVHQHGVKKNYLHAILDGRDTPPQSAQASLQAVSDQYARFGCGKIASIVGRYYAMDRDNRWERTQKAYDLLTQGIATYHAPTAMAALQNAYQHHETDEFVKPTSIYTEGEKPITIADGDVVIFMNFRADRARQLTLAFTEKTFSGFKRQRIPTLAAFVTLTEYANTIQANVAFPPLKLSNTLGEYIATLGMHQLRIAETEKYAHVTYFFNGGIEKPNPGEDRLLIPSPKVATYDLKPEMSAPEVTDKLIDAIRSHRYDLIICNFANPDMVGHTGNEEATKKAIVTIDTCLRRLIDALKTVGGEALITADHGNAELMFDKKTGQPHTAHTNNLVPLIYVGREAKFRDRPGALDDVAPTLLYLLGLKPPAEMTGTNLITLLK